MNRKVEILNIDYDHRDYPDFCDAFITEAQWDNGELLTDQELDHLNEDQELVYNEVIRRIF